MVARKRVAIVGSGCSGLAALWALKNTSHEVHLYEAKERIGGHTNTVSFDHDGRSVKVDTGFIVMNTATYPNFIKFLEHIKVPPIETPMTFGVSRDHGAFEWAGTSLSSIFAQRSNISSSRFWLMLFDVVRFNQFALDVLREAPESESDPSGASKSKGAGAPSPNTFESIGSYLEREGYSEGFINDYLIPMTAAVWSTSPDRAALEFPAVTLIRFLWNHHLLTTIAVRPAWMTIKGGSQRYIDAILKDFPEHQIHLQQVVKKVDNRDGDVELTLEDGSRHAFEHVIIATHGDTAAELIREGANRAEREVMSNFHTSENVAVLHSDRSLMPKLESTWSSWNYLTRTSPSGGDVATVCLTYWMNLLQHIPTSTYGDILVTLNPLHWPKRETIQGSWTYHHPLYTSAAIWSQSQLPRIQNTRGISYAGAWTKYGFHEDGFSSGLKVAVEHLGAELPFDFVDSTFSRGKRPQLGWLDQVARVLILLVHIMILVGGGLVSTLGLGKWYGGRASTKSKTP